MVERKQRTRELIELGGLVRAVGLDGWSSAEIVGALLIAVERDRAEPLAARREFRRRGDVFFRERKGAGDGVADSKPPR